MTISKTRIEKKIARKRNPELRRLIIKLKKQNQLEVASMLSLPKRKGIELNIGRLNKETKEGDKVLVLGKVLGTGNINHKIIIAAFSFSEDAKSKLKGCSIIDIEDAIKSKDFRIIK
jgi:large subunit ribosomal protein L18e